VDLWRFTLPPGKPAGAGPMVSFVAHDIRLDRGTTAKPGTVLNSGIG
jgi:hypothetical protein